jgi:ABC-type sugar transport system ATPase subunit
MTQITLHHITKSYDGQNAALHDINLTIADGETVSVVGPSGCGKSTLLKIVAGLEFPEQGQIFYNGHDVTEIKPQARGVGMVFQDYALYPTRRGEGNLAYFFEVHQRSAAEEQARIKATADLMGVDFAWLLGRTPDTLSGGQQQRVAIARCIVRDPNLFLMDEPIVNLDAKLRERTRMEIKKLLRQFAITTLYVTHDQQEAIFMGDRIAVMRRGRIEQIGTFDELYYTPANLFVATFIGAPPISVLPATLENGQLTLANTTWPLPAELGDRLPVGAVRVGVRPEGWRLDAPTGAALTVRHIERIPTQQAAFIHGTLAGSAVTALAPLDYPTVHTLAVAPLWENALFFAAEGEAILHTPGTPDLF